MKRESPTLNERLYTAATMAVVVRRSARLLIVRACLLPAACSSPAAHPVQEYTFLTASSPAFARDLIAHYNKTVPFVHVSPRYLRTGAAAVVADLRSGAGQ